MRVLLILLLLCPVLAWAQTPTPVTVTTLALSQVTPTSIEVRWTNTDNGLGQPSSYTMRIAQGALTWGSQNDIGTGACKAPLVGTSLGGTQTCLITGLAANTSYQIQMVAFRGTLNQDAVFSASTSNKITVSTPAPPVSLPGKVLGLSIVVTTTAEVALTWDANTETDLNGYKVYRALSTGAYGAPLATLPKATTSYTAVGLLSGTRYFFVVTAFNISGNESPFSNEVGQLIP